MTHDEREKVVADTEPADGQSLQITQTEETEEKIAVTVQVTPQTKMQKFLQFVKFALFSLSAGILQFLTTSVLFDWTHWLPYWAAYVIGLTVSVIWNFTFNRKFTFGSAANVPLAMTLVVIYNCIIVVPLAFGGDALAKLWGDPYGMVVTVIALLINFVTEFFWDKFIVFNDKVINRIEIVISRKKSSELAVSADSQATENAPDEEPVDEATETPDEETAKEETDLDKETAADKS